MLDQIKKILCKLYEFNITYINFSLKVLFSIMLKVIWFFTDTIFGYSIFLFAFFYGFFGCTYGNCNLSHTLVAVFAITITTTVVETYILIKIRFSKAYLENILERKFIIDHLV